MFLSPPVASDPSETQNGGDSEGSRDVYRAGACAGGSGDDHGPGLPREPQHGGPRHMGQAVLHPQEDHEV